VFLRFAGLDLYRVRDELAQSYNPANALERMLVSQMAQSWLRLQRAQEAEERYFQAHDVLDAIANDFARYKAITRLLADCERAWRHAMLHLEKLQRRRQRVDTFSPNARRRQPAAGDDRGSEAYATPGDVQTSGSLAHPFSVVRSG
jgi:hypothetical protein